MAGVKGRSGGARPGAGRPRKNAAGEGERAETAPRQAAGSSANHSPQSDLGVPAVAGQDPLEFLLAVQNSASAPLKDRIRAAVAAAQYVHTKRADGGKKEDAAEKAKKAAGGRFAPKAPPKLVVSNR